MTRGGKGGNRFYVMKRNKRGKMKQAAFTETYKPPGNMGLEITIKYNTRLDPDGIQAFQPLARMCAVVANHVRTRIQDLAMGYDGAPMGPAEVSGAMWRSMTTSITGKGKARAYFKGSSDSTRRTNPSPRSKTATGWKSKGRGTVLNKMKALTASGLGVVPPRDKAGRFMWWKPQLRQQFASGKHSPVSLFMLANQEVMAAQSVLSLGMQQFMLKGEVDLSDWKGMGDRKLVQEIRRALGV